jgi:hypothetical protein
MTASPAIPAGYTNLREGDVIHVRMLVCEAKQLVQAKLADGDTLYVARNEIVHVEPWKPRKDSLVRHAAFPTPGLVLDVYGSFAWVHFDNDAAPMTVRVDQLGRHTDG